MTETETPFVLLAEFLAQGSIPNIMLKKKVGHV